MKVTFPPVSCSNERNFVPVWGAGGAFVHIIEPVDYTRIGRPVGRIAASVPALEGQREQLQCADCTKGCVVVVGQSGLIVQTCAS